jgi:hypothetical protein
MYGTDITKDIKMIQPGQICFLLILSLVSRNAYACRSTSDGLEFASQIKIVHSHPKFFYSAKFPANGLNSNKVTASIFYSEDKDEIVNMKHESKVPLTKKGNWFIANFEAPKMTNLYSFFRVNWSMNMCGLNATTKLHQWPESIIDTNNHL